jgi:predicted enzyme related to lactoylglutathione lyase
MPLGDFVWYDLITRDEAAARKFYAELLGWTFNEVAMGDYVYPMIVNDGRPIGGVFEQNDLPADGPAHWLANLQVKSADVAAKLATDLGATLQAPPTDIPDVGRFCVVLDPQGAAISFFAPNPDAPAAPKFTPQKHGFIWTELQTTDDEAAKSFYAAIAGWSYAAHNMGPQGAYWIASVGEMRVAGLMKIPAHGGPPRSFWMPYIAVEDADVMAARAKSLGGSIVVAPADIPNVGRFAVIADPTGAATAIMRPFEMR